DRENAIVNVLRFFEAKNALVFCSTRATVNHMTSRFSNRGFSVVALSGELSQNERTHALQAMRDGRARVCVATDVAARGIDLPNLELVVHADIPKSKETLLHRSGRTGRAGRKGVCALIVPYNQRKRTERLLENANIEAKWARPPSVDEIMMRDRERIMEDPVLSEPLNEFEQSFAKELLTRYSPEQVAAAFVRQNFADRTAPEELLDNTPEEPRALRKQREDFKNGVWFSLSVGREQNAEARWLLPMLCRAGHITKTEIGAIRIHQMETHVELTPDCVEGFLKAVGPTGVVDKGVTISRLDGLPDTPRGPRDRPQGKKRSYKDSGLDDRKRKPHRKSSRDSRDGAGDDKSKPRGKYSKGPRDGERDDQPKGKPANKFKGKKTYKSSFDNPRAETKGQDDSGSRPLKRKKPFKKPK
nr:DbpA RNA binding domain-containing protein [Rhodospirillaceae bacterium]